MNWKDSGIFIKAVLREMHCKISFAEKGWTVTSINTARKSGQADEVKASKGIRMEIGKHGYVSVKGTIEAVLNFLQTPAASKMLWKHRWLDNTTFTTEEMRERLQPIILYCKLSNQHERNSIYCLVKGTTILASISMSNDTLTVIHGPSYAVEKFLSEWRHPETRFYARGATKPKSALEVLSRLRGEELPALTFNALLYQRWWMERDSTHPDIDSELVCCLANESEGCESCDFGPE